MVGDDFSIDEINDDDDDDDEPLTGVCSADGAGEALTGDPMIDIPCTPKTVKLLRPTVIIAAGDSGPTPPSAKVGEDRS